MQLIINWLITVAKPFMWLLENMFALLVKIDSWYKTKQPATRKDMRWRLVCTLLAIWAINERLSGDSRLVDERLRNTLLLNAAKKQIDECEQWKIARLEKEIKELKSIKENDEQFKKDIQDIKKKI